jgi:predicted  nucleic acid-binding Zn-ribbon protein
MSTIEETKVIQAINRLEDARNLLSEVGRKDNRFSEKFNGMNSELEKFEKQLQEIREKLNVENLGVKGMAIREF